jgi:hypothetical protein
MIRIEINPVRIEQILFLADSPLEEDLDFAAWQAIRPLVRQIDQRLAKIVGLVDAAELGRRTQP